jgi:glycosyltransferase involved in cell wall biosynthesis
MSMKISVFITSYNQKDYLVEAIESVLNQTLPPFEIIIVDDCSTDGSQKVIAEYAQRYPDLIRPFYHRQNLGIPRNKSFALEQVRGDLVTYVDGDDRFLPRKLEMELKTLLNHPDAQIVYSNVYHINPQGRRSHLWCDGDISPPTGYVFREAFARAFPRGSLFRNELVSYQCLKETGFYDPEFAMYHDWELRIRLTRRFGVAYCSTPLSEYRFHPGGISRSGASRHLDEMKRVYAKHRSLLEALPESDRTFIEESLSAKLAQFSLQVAREEIKKGRIKRAFKYCLESWRHNPKGFGLRLVAEILLPQQANTRLRAVYRSLRNTRR